MRKNTGKKKKTHKHLVTKVIQSWEVKYGQILFSGNDYEKAYLLFKPLLSQRVKFNFQYPKGVQKRNFVHYSRNRVIRLACKSFFGKLKPGTGLSFSIENGNVICFLQSKALEGTIAGVLNRKQESILIEKANVLGKMILAMRGIYSNASSSQKRLMETVVGAAIFYFPRNQNLWTGKLSKKALDHLSKEGTTKGLTQEHQYPRKEAGRELLAGISGGSDDIAAEICDLYLNRYGCYNWVTSKENKQLVDFQKQGVFSTPETAYKNAGIKLLELTKDQFQELKKGKRSVLIK